MIEIIRPGLLTTVQDLGRTGFQCYGIVVGGAMDEMALRIANLLVGNAPESAGLEGTLVGPALRFEQDTLIAITGGDLAPTIDGRSLPMWRPLLMRQGSLLSFGPARAGCRAYLAVAGGLAVQPVLGSSSTYLRAGIGGWQGRALQKGDRLASGRPSAWAVRQSALLSAQDRDQAWAATGWRVSAGLLPGYRSDPTVRVIAGGQWEAFTEESRLRLLTAAFRLTPQSDRMGYRLQGPCLQVSRPLEMISEAVTFGTVQVPPEGGPILLMADRQTTGGYPKIAQVANVDLPLLAQLRPGDTVQFALISVEAAQSEYRARERDIQVFHQGLLIRDGGEQYVPGRFEL